MGFGPNLYLGSANHRIKRKRKKQNRLGVRYDQSADTGGGDIYKLGWRKAMGAKTESLAIRDGNDFFSWLV